MNQEAQLIAAIVALWGASCSLAGIVYKVEEARIAEWRGRCKTLEADARAAVMAKDEELKQWRRLLHQQLSG